VVDESREVVEKVRGKSNVNNGPVVVVVRDLDTVVADVAVAVVEDVGRVNVTRAATNPAILTSFDYFNRKSRI